MTETNHSLLIVEDSPEDYKLTVRALEKAGFRNPLHRCIDGDDALDFLHRRGAYAAPAVPLPSMILLDLNMPGTDGREVLQELKTDENLRKIPVVVLTTSKDDRDVRYCYGCGANSYIQKPLGLEGFFKAMQGFTDFWFKTAILPH